MKTILDSAFEGARECARPAVWQGVLLAGLLATTSVARSQDVEAETPRMLETVVVSGEQPGPGLWRVIADDGNTLWVLATVLPLPKRMEWTAREVDARVAGSGVVLMGPRLDVDVDRGIFGKLFLLPALLKARNNPEKDRLVDVLPEALYQRWAVLKQRYMGRKRSVEKRRPIIAAQELLEAALDKEDLSWRNIASRRVERSAKRGKVPVERPAVKVLIAEPRQLLKELGELALNDTACLERTLDRLENDLDTMKLRANAWALGEIDILRSLSTTESFRACADALLENKVAQKHGFTDLEQRLRETWISAAEKALAEHESSFALLPLGLVVNEDGYLATLAARGYRIEAPRRDGDEASAEATESARDPEGG